MAELSEQLNPQSQQRVRHDMVRWYNPRQMLRTGLHVASATVVGQIADYREVQAALDPIGDDEMLGAFDYSDAAVDGDFWLDYVADLGDGWHSTHSVASELARETIATSGGDLPRGQVLIMGGDEVYPDPSVQAYEERLIAPYEAACKKHGGFAADLFAVPGNHDWYDGLKAFTTIFCKGSRGRPVGCWRTRQPRSYFALQLPQRWWICGVDIQLAADLNPAQVDYFTQISQELMQPDDRVILCAPQPGWVFEKTRSPDALDNYYEIAEILTAGGADIRLALSGDLHHYSRYEPNDLGPVLITAGGGGAFQHPTHKLPESVGIDDGNGGRNSFSLAAAYPEKRVSRALTYKNLLFPFINWDFAALIGVVYAFLAWFLETRQESAKTSLSDAFIAMMAGHSSIGDALARFFQTIPKSPEFAIVVLIVYIGLINLNLSNNRWLSIALGTAHTLLHFTALIAAFCVAVQVAHWVSPHFDDQLGAAFLIFLGLMVVLGGLLGGLVIGLYLIFALNVLGLQWTNCFSALRIADFNNFLRLRIDAEGRLHVHPMKIERASRTLPTGHDVPASRAEPIETPIVIS